PASRGELNRIRKQVPDDLLQPGGVTDDDLRSRDVTRAQLDAFGLRQRAHHIEGVGEYGVDVQRARFQPQLAANNASGVEQIFDQSQLRPGVALDDVAGLFQLLQVMWVLAQQAVVTEDRVQGRAQFVRDNGEEFILAAVRGLGLGAGRRFLEQQFLSFDLDALALSDVAGDFRYADHFSGLISNGRDRERNVNLIAVFAPAHSFIMIDLLATPEAFEDLRFFVYSLRRNQNRHRLSDDFRRRITE